MKQSLQPCRQFRQSLALLAGGVLSPVEKATVESHLTGCAACQTHLNELKAATSSLVNWESELGNVEPSHAFQTRLVNAVQNAHAGNTTFDNESLLCCTSWK